MAIPSVTASSVSSYQDNSLDDSRQTFLQLAKAIRSGDLSGAQQAYSALTQTPGNGQSNASGSTTPLGRALNQIGEALQNGDIDGAQQALASLSQQSQGSGRHHHHDQSDGGGGTGGGGTGGPPPCNGGTGTVVNLTA